MHSPLSVNRHDEPAEKTAEEIEALVRRIVKKIAHPPTEDAAINANNIQNVLLDIEVDGVRCVLIRKKPEESQLRIVLSPREREIARMIAKGYPNKTIARVLDISTWTVGTYLRRIFAKLGVCSRAAMVARISSEGWLAETSPAFSHATPATASTSQRMKQG